MGYMVSRAPSFLRVELTCTQASALSCATKRPSGTRSLNLMLQRQATTETSFLFRPPRSAFVSAGLNSYCRSKILCKPCKLLVVRAWWWRWMEREGGVLGLGGGCASWEVG